MNIDLATEAEAMAITVSLTSEQYGDIVQALESADADLTEYLNTDAQKENGSATIAIFVEQCRRWTKLRDQMCKAVSTVIA